MHSEEFKRRLCSNPNFKAGKNSGLKQLCESFINKRLKYKASLGQNLYALQLCVP